MSIRSRLERLERSIGQPDEVLEIEVYYEDEDGNLSDLGPPERVRDDLILRWPDVD